MVLKITLLDVKKLEQEVKGDATVITSVTDCPDGGKKYKLVDGKCILKVGGGVNDPSKARTKKCRCNGKVTGEVPNSRHPQDCPKCEGKEKDPKDPKDPKIKKCRKKWQTLVDGECVGNKPTDDDKAGIKDGVQGVDKKPGMKKVCTDWEWVEKGSGQGKKRSSAGPKPK